MHRIIQSMETKMKSISQKIDYIRDENDSFQTYLDKAIQYQFRCIFARNKEEYDYAKDYLKNKDCIIAGAIDFPEGKMTLNEKLEMRNGGAAHRNIEAPRNFDSASCCRHRKRSRGIFLALR